MFLLPRGAK